MNATSGPTSPPPLAYYDPASRSLRTSQGTFPWDSTPSSPTLPASGSMRAGAVYAHRTSAPHTSANASSSSPGLPTPRARDARGRGFPDGLPAIASLLPTPSTSEATGTGHAAQGGMNLRHAVSLLPTPRASENENRQTKRTPSQIAGKHGKCLAAEVCSLLPTPVVGDSKGARQSTAPNPRSPSPTLTDLAYSGALLPTPTATPYGTNQSMSPGAAVRPSLNSLASSGALLPTPRATDGSKGGPNQRGSKGDLTLPSAAHRAGASTATRSAAGKQSSDAALRGQLTLWDG